MDRDRHPARRIGTNTGCQVARHGVLGVYPVIVDVTSTGAGEAEMLELVRTLRDLPDVEHVRVRRGTRRRGRDR